MSDQINDVTLRRYLLADIDPAERERIEERLFSEEGFADELARAEAGLVDDYAFHVLPSRDRDLFERNFVFNDERRRNLLFARAVEAYLDEDSSPSPEPHPRSSWKRLLLFFEAHRGLVAAGAAAAIVLALLLGPILMNWLSDGERLASLPAVEVSLQPREVLRGGGEMPQIEVGKEAKVLNLTFTLPAADYEKYSVTARTFEGVEVFSMTDLKAQTNGVPRISFRVSSASLPPDDYTFEVKGIGPHDTPRDIASYNLRVVGSPTR